MGTDGTEIEAWRDLCRRMEALGERLLEGDFPADPSERADGLAHLAEQLTCWIGWSVFHADPRRPFFQRQNDLVTQWGGPNADNVYRHARVDPARRYRIRGRMHSCNEFILAVRRGFMHEPSWGTVFEVSASDLGLGPGDDVDLFVGGGDADVELPDGAVMVSIREYYFDWDAAEPALLTIECLDDDTVAPLPRLTGDELAARLDAAARGVEHSMEYWRTYTDEVRAGAGEANWFAPPLKLEKGLDAARYLHLPWALGPKEALVVDTDVPDARYWSVQLYEHTWWELADTVERQISLNHREAVVDGDGRVRVVVSSRDPGVANWLDCGDREEGLFMLRWFWPAGDAPEPTATVVPVDEVASVLPADTRFVDAGERAEALRRRRRHLAWRFRT